MLAVCLLKQHWLTVGVSYVSCVFVKAALVDSVSAVSCVFVKGQKMQRFRGIHLIELI